MGDELIHDRTGAAVALAAVGSAFGGWAIGVATADLGLVDTTYPYLTIGVGLVAIVGVTFLAGWYMPSAREVAELWDEYQRLEDGDSDG